MGGYKRLSVYMSIVALCLLCNQHHLHQFYCSCLVSLNLCACLVSCIFSIVQDFSCLVLTRTVCRNSWRLIISVHWNQSSEESVFSVAICFSWRVPVCLTAALTLVNTESYIDQLHLPLDWNKTGTIRFERCNRIRSMSQEVGFVIISVARKAIL